jgi:hypothetical protein
LCAHIVEREREAAHEFVGTLRELNRTIESLREELGPLHWREPVRIERL